MHDVAFEDFNQCPHVEINIHIHLDIVSNIVNAKSKSIN